ncbi:MAG TPA: ABC transporter permease [Candidatus Atribacteria bacterium]|nr:ABC transporter permease [Candidatus Atribacteria bacterium]
MIVSDFITHFIAADLRTATPILFAALGELYMERSGIINIGLEGFMLIGALTGSISSYFFNSALLGVIMAALVSGVLGLIYAFFVVTIKANQVATGIAINIFSLGLTTTIYRAFMGVNTSHPNIASFKNISIPLLSKIPIFGQSIFNQTALVYLALMLVPFTYYFLYKTSIGLKIRAAGEYPQATDTAGVNVFQIRYGAIIGGSMLVGVGGAYLSLGLLNMFTENMVAGRGFIALAAVIFGKWNPWGVLGAALFFGFGDALAIRLQVMGSSIPYQFLLMLPYIFTVAVLAGVVGKAFSPTALGIPYNKE